PSLSFLGNLSPDFCYLKGGDMEPFALSQKLEDLAVEVHEAMQQYPKSEKYGLAKETDLCVIRAAAMVARANKLSGYREKRECIDKADNELAILKIMLRLGNRLKYISNGRYGIIAGLVVEAGKMIGGWIKSSAIKG
ncbi:MAG TPA: four helix bundle protein, partial [Rectinema sp.]|nr:four helix bundle protein [Rectinema sp.]